MSCYQRKGYNIDVMKQSACLEVNPVTVDHFPYLFNCTPVDRGSASLMARLKKIKLFIRLFGPRHFMSVSQLNGAQLLVFLCSSIPVALSDNPGISKCLNTMFLFASSLSEIYLLPVMIHGWVGRPINICFTTMEADGEGCDSVKLD